MEPAVEKLNLLLCKADSELTTLECKVDQEYSTLAAAAGSQAQVSPAELAKNVQQLRNELKTVSADILELQNQQKQIMTTVLSQLKSLCTQFDELNEQIYRSVIMSDERNFRSQYYEKVGFRCVEEKRSIETLLKDQPVDEKKLTNFSLRMTLPAAYRTLVWKLLLGITPRHPGARDYVQQQQVLMYEELWSTLQALRLTQDYIPITPAPLVLPSHEPYEQGRPPKPHHYLMMWLISNAKLLFNPMAQLRAHNNQCFLLIVERIDSMYKDPLDVFLMCSALWEDIDKNRAAIEGAIQDTCGMLRRDNEALYQHLRKVGFFSSNIPLSFCLSLFCGIFPESAAEKVLDKIVAGCYKVLAYVLTALLTYLRRSLLTCGSAHDMHIVLNELSEEGADIVVSSAMEQWHKVAITGTQKAVISATN